MIDKTKIDKIVSVLELILSVVHQALSSNAMITAQNNAQLQDAQRQVADLKDDLGQDDDS